MYLSIIDTLLRNAEKAITRLSEKMSVSAIVGQLCFTLPVLPQGLAWTSSLQDPSPCQQENPPSVWDRTFNI